MLRFEGSSKGAQVRISCLFVISRKDLHFLQGNEARVKGMVFMTPDHQIRWKFVSLILLSLRHGVVLRYGRSLFMTGAPSGGMFIFSQATVKLRRLICAAALKGFRLAEWRLPWGSWELGPEPTIWIRIPLVRDIFSFCTGTLVINHFHFLGPFWLWKIPDALPLPKECE